MAIGTYGRTASVYNLLSQCGRFGPSTEAAAKEIERIAAILGDWRDHLRVRGVSAKDIEYIAPAFLPECFFFNEPPQAEK